MRQFKCEACGYEYTDTHTYTACPNCSGCEKLDEGCTCKHWRSPISGNPIAISTKDPNCPVHSVGNTSRKT